MEKHEQDDGKPWGYLENGVFHELPKLPMLRANLGPTPFSVILVSGEIRAIIHPPECNNS